MKRAAPSYDWNFSLKDAQARYEKVQKGWEDMLLLAYMVHNKADPERWPDVYSHYFNEKDQTKVETVFHDLVGATEDVPGGNPAPDGGAELLKNIIISNKRVTGDLCNDPKYIAFLAYPEDETKFILRLCEPAWEFPLFSDRKCEDVGDRTSGKMSLLGGVILHEMM